MKISSDAEVFVWGVCNLEAETKGSKVKKKKNRYVFLSQWIIVCILSTMHYEPLSLKRQYFELDVT